MSFSSYFTSLPAGDDNLLKGCLGNYMSTYQSDTDLSDYDLALFTVSTSISSIDNMSKRIIGALSALYPNGFEPKLLIMGSMIVGEKESDTNAAIIDVCDELLSNRVVPIVIADNRDVTINVYKAFERAESVVNITSVDNTLNILKGEEEGYMSRVIKSQPNFLFNYSNLGYQTYLTDPEELTVSEQLFFDAYRLGEVRGDIHMTEPILRGSEVISVSLDVVKASDFSSNHHPQPNGLYAEEICQIMRFSALSEKNRVVVISDLDFESKNEADALLISEMIWCYLEGYYMRRKEMPHSNSTGFLKYRVSLKEDEFHLIFYKSVKTDRWWMEVPVPPEYANKYRKHHLVPCDYDDYKVATEDDLPNRWWKAYKKML